MTLATTLLLAVLAWSDAPSGEAPLILDFHASWCGPCQQMRPVVDRLQAKRYPIKSVDVDAAKDLARRYRVTGVPTFVVVDPSGKELARTSGVQPAAELAKLYNDAVAKAGRSAPAATGTGATKAAATAVAARSETKVKLPRPWETAVRVKVEGQGAIGFGSGTVIHSTAEETVILTCAHIFHIDGARRQPAPADFNRRILIDLFDGVLHGQHPMYVHPVETVEGEAVDYDFKSDVGLIRIRPGRILPVSPVVPADWKPANGMAMTTVGCSEGRNASPWSTVITNAAFQGMVAGRLYKAIECQHPPLQGRSGGGLYTVEGYLAGVCNFAEPNGGHGLYASPASIHTLLDRNELTLCYNPSAAPAQNASGALLASRTRNTNPAARTTVRAQNDRLPESGNRTIPVPEPDRVGVSLPPLSNEGASAAVASRSGAGSSWQARGNRTASIDEPPPAAMATDLQMDPSVADQGLPAPSPERTRAARSSSSSRRPSAPAEAPSVGGWRAGRSTSSASDN